MCLWFAQMCEECDRITAIPWEQPIPCHHRCERKLCNPNNLTDEERVRYLDFIGMCCKHCDFDDCGVYVRVVECGHKYAISKTCKTNLSSDEQ